MDLNFAQALWVLGYLESDKLPGVAKAALSEGVDSPALRMLAGLQGEEVSEAKGIFSRALKELGLIQVNKQNAACTCATKISKQILDKEISPQDGANKLWDASIRVKDPSFHELDVFIYAASELQSRPEDKEFFVSEILKEASRWALKKLSAI